jgi:serine/threonine-protein kinase
MTQRPWLLAGRYRVREVIGRGGMSTVYRATDTVLGRRVAVKVLLPVLAQGDPANIIRFEREARAAAALRHPAVVKIYDTGTDEGAHFIVMEYVAGRALDDMIRQRGLDARRAAGISAQVAEALAAAHAAGVLHRDIKPANVMVRPDGTVKVLDFGIARTVQDTTITQPSFAIGTAAYMPPERVLGRSGDERSDIYALGCLVYALLTGRPPFVADEPVAILHQQVHADPVPLGKAGAHAPPGLDRLVMRMLAKDPADRPQSAAEVAGQLSAAAGATAETAAAPAVGATAETAVAPAAGRPAPSGAATRRGRGRPLPVAALVLAVATIAAVAVVALGGGGAKSSGLSGLHSRPARNSSQHAGSALQESTRQTAPASSTPSTGPAAGRPRGQAKKPKPPKPAKPPKHPGHVPPGHGGVPPGQAGNQGGDGAGD